VAAPVMPQVGQNDTDQRDQLLTPDPARKLSVPRFTACTRNAFAITSGVPRLLTGFSPRSIWAQDEKDRPTRPAVSRCRDALPLADDHG
jgi:hypothetical protein